ncbi:helix-turn-helix domain-containing protein [Agrobacterium vitis]|uniref:helix-turn-helix domain-containing protein n=1 Tax=Agrobacterium vitis TaxID=373 RepID=UPI0012E7E32F|nr:helix-turn-helix domain-containing protein [Agrobacterium vitis]MVA63615.1 transposase [Agrobacterium vitis]
MSAMPLEHPVPVKASSRLLCHSVARVTEEIFVVFQSPTLMHAGRRRQRCQIRQIAMYLCHVVLSLPQHEIARAFGYDRSTVSYACHVIEDRRENAALDQFLGVLERVVAVLSTVAKDGRDA